jgi:hypothetical protein
MCKRIGCSAWKWLSHLKRCGIAALVRMCLCCWHLRWHVGDRTDACVAEDPDVRKVVTDTATYMDHGLSTTVTTTALTLHASSDFEDAGESDGEARRCNDTSTTEPPKSASQVRSVQVGTWVTHPHSNLNFVVLGINWLDFRSTAWRACLHRPFLKFLARMCGQRVCPAHGASAQVDGRTKAGKAGKTKKNAAQRLAVLKNKGKGKGKALKQPAKASGRAKGKRKGK